MREQCKWNDECDISWLEHIDNKLFSNFPTAKQLSDFLIPFHKT